MKKNVAWIAVAVLVGIAIGVVARKDAPNAAKVMTPTERKILFYRNPMGSGHTSPTPMKDEMGMEYIPVYGDEATQTPGLVRIDPVIVQNIGVRTAPVKSGQLAREIRAPATLTFDESRLQVLTARVSGRISQLHANAVGALVREHTPLYDIESPELSTMLQEFLAAKRYQESLTGADTATRNTANQISVAARLRLGLMGLSGAQMQRIESMQAVPTSMTFDAPVSGVVIKKSVTEGEYVTAGTTLFTIADMSRVWAVAEIFNADVGSIHMGQAASVLIQGQTKPIPTQIEWIGTNANPETRALRVRVSLDNRRGLLHPDTFATLVIHNTPRQATLMVPKSAVLRTGKQDVVIVQIGKGVFETREVHLEGEAGDMYGISSGLHLDEIIVTSAQFLLDSESKVRDAIRNMSAPTTAPTQP